MDPSTKTFSGSTSPQAASTPTASQLDEESSARCRGDRPDLSYCPGVQRVARCITFSDTDCMAKAISVRLDDEAERALRTLESSGLSQSDAIRSSLLASARRLRRGRDLAAEAAALEADETDRAEMASPCSA